MDNTKGQKLIAALYLVTQHLSDNDPIKMALRENGIRFVEAEGAIARAVAETLDTLLGAAVLAQLISEKNGSIIRLELSRYATIPLDTQTDHIAALFSEPAPMPRTLIKRTGMSYIPPQSKTSSDKKDNKMLRSYSEIFDNKNKRQDTILSFINDRKAASIKDIATLFPDVSEKTIQRELGTLVANGKITKRGEKRWSVYMAVNARA